MENENKTGPVAPAVYDNRRTQLQILVDQRCAGSLAAFAELYGYDRSQISQYLSESYNHGRSMGERAARSLEEKAGLPSGWLDRGDDADDMDIASNVLPALPEWVKLAPREVSVEFLAYGREAWTMGLDYGMAHAPAADETTLPDLARLLKSAAIAGNAVKLSHIAAGTLYNAMTSAPAAARDACAEMRALCSSCGGTGDVHRSDGEWMGECTCALAVADRDAARYRWLRNQMSFSTLGGAPAEMNLRAMIPAPDHNCHVDWMEERFDASVDRAIDAAMRAAAPATESAA